MSRIVYVDQVNACCPWSDEAPYGQLPYKSQQQLIADKDVFARLYIVDDDDLSEIWGDDWNDAPSCSNSGSPYEGKNLRVVELRYGDEWPAKPHDAQFFRPEEKP